jgi:hypothetical protein
MKNAALLSALIYSGISLAAAAVFVLATLAGSYTLVERIGGAFWVFLLSMIILMPLVIPAVRRRMR